MTTLTKNDGLEFGSIFMTKLLDFITLFYYDTFITSSAPAVCTTKLFVTLIEHSIFMKH
jgi:hypothetical protein